ncbi:CocE/NonD family hydrolase [Sphingomonas sp. SFZ2018-12]|uniref:CocE/NonD family hydrolase n=1 Tax=Sphingomonas sp. SFZ2018-12 TaxID=2683197 RepID=UPI001F0DFF4E|nr:CocE/NonD family hydrolase [Sphingomonas sp. SFZ2018-12]MCH4893618.1 CocE/NonD family hydrolase [Sphingomonas sp. SFZ2018-12]
MRVRTGLALALLLAASSALARPQPQPAPQSAPQAQPTAAFTFEEVMIPMRDGARLQTVIMRPVGKSGPLPILLQRTPYGVPDAPPPQTPRTMQFMAEDGYILVFQNMRGRFKSDGKFTMSMELAPAGSKAVDEATDAYDTIDWLVKRVPANNGRVGMWGVSYPGYAAAIALTRPHPALKAVSPQAAWNDWWLNDDLHRYGAMRLTYATDWLYSLQHNKENAEFPYGSGFVDSYDFFLKLGPVSNLDSRYMRGTVPMLTAMIAHPDYDDHWRRQHWTDRLGRTTVPTLHVAGFWDQEDPSGSWKIYEQMEQDDPDGLNLMVAGPWNHGSWRSPGDRLGNIPMGVESGTEFRRDVEAPFFRYWLHGKGAQPRFEAKMFQSGSWQWRDYAQWPPKPREMRNLYLHTDGSLSFTAPADTACRDYVSDPASPVPFRARPISRTYPSPEWQWWEAADQRFVDGRPDVLTYVSAPLESDLTVTGAIAARLMAATSGTDADMVVKLIDVFPDDYEPVPADYLKTLNGYQLPVAMEVRRGRWLDGNAVAKPLVADQVRAWDVPLRDHDHVFRRGHRLMVQVQSTWFPVIDRNPQTFVPNIYTAKASDFRKATHRVCGGSYVALPVM